MDADISPADLGRMYLHYARTHGRDATRYGLVSELLRRAWCRETASPSCRDGWSPANPAFGQCAVTALVVQDLMGGTLMRADMPGFGSHYWNWLPNGEDVYPLDLTWSQFTDGTPRPIGSQVGRERLLEGERALAAATPERYALLKRRVADLMSVG